MIEKLKPCPFCGEKAELTWNSQGQHYIKCNSCDGGMFTFATTEEKIKETVDAWNKRAGDENDA